MSLPMLKLKVYELHTKMEIVCRSLGTVDAPSCIFIYTEEEKILVKNCNNFQYNILIQISKKRRIIL